MTIYIRPHFLFIFSPYLYVLMTICGIFLRFIIFSTIDDNSYPKEKKITKFMGDTYIILGIMLFVVSFII